MRIGIFGGSFDPPHLGHLILAETARGSVGLEKVVFIPAAQSPLKPHGPVASGRQRREMLDLATAGNPHFEVSVIELEREGISYTVDTLEQLARKNADAEWFLLMGADSLEQFGKWRSPERICELALPLVAARRGSSTGLEALAPYVSVERLAAIRARAFEFPWIEISSTELRECVRQHLSIRYRVPAAVEAYIENAGLYGGN